MKRVLVTLQQLLASALARRLLLLFMLSALVPIVVLSALSYSRTTAALRTARDVELTQTAYAYGAAIAQRLQRASAMLAAAAERGDTRGEPRGDPRDTAQAYLMRRFDDEFSAVGQRMADGRLEHWAGRLPAIDPLPAEAQYALAAGKAVLVTTREAPAAIVLLHPLAGARDGAALAVALQKEALWGARDATPLMIDLCVLTASALPLHCATAPPAAATAALIGRLGGGGADSVQWQRDGEVMRSNGSHQELPAGLHGTAVVIIASQSESSLLAPVRSFALLFFPVALLAALLASALALQQIGGLLQPLRQLLEATRRVAQQDFSTRVAVGGSDEFAQLGKSFNEMARRLDLQFSTLKALSQIDRAILKNLDLSGAAKSSLRSVRSITGADIVCIGLLEPDQPDTMRVYIVRGDEDTRAERGYLTWSPEVLAQMTKPAARQWGPLTALPADLTALLKCGQRQHCWLQPIARDERYWGLMLLAHERPLALSEERQSLLRGVADRMTVALTSAERDRRLHSMAHLDALTGLPNRHSLLTLLAQELTHARREKYRVGVLFIDLDRFKQANDTLGHAAGDLLLTKAAERIKENLRSTDTVGRHGGDEFSVVLSRLASARDAGHVARELIKALSRSFDIDGHTVYVGASAGIALYPDDGGDGPDLLKKADTAMYRAKEQGRNRYAFFEPTMNAEVTQRATLDRELRQAFERGEFVLHYQPQIDLRTGLVCAAEALVRWQHPQRGLLYPGTFIPFAEESGLIDAIGTWVLREACLQHGRWRAQGALIPRVAVNVSNRQLRRSRFVQIVDATIVATSMPPDCLEIEVTESLFLDGGRAAINALKALEEAGTRVAIDDFGTGYSSFGYLKTLPASVIKLDRSFVTDIATDQDAAAIAAAIIKMAHMLRKEVVAEGVETEAQLALLRQLACEKVQGYLFSKALPADEAAAFAASRSLVTQASG